MAIDKSKFIRIIKEQFPGISDDGIKAIMGNISLETAGGSKMREVSYPAGDVEGHAHGGRNGLFSTKGPIDAPTSYRQDMQTARKHLIEADYGTATLRPDGKDYVLGSFRQTAKQKADYNALDSDQRSSLAYNGNIDGFAGGFGPLQLTAGTGAVLGDRNTKLQEYMDANGIDLTIRQFMAKLADEPEYGLEHTLAFYKHHDSGDWNTASLNDTNTSDLSEIINPGRDVADISSGIDTGNAWATDSIGTYNNLDLALEENHQYNVGGVPPRPEGVSAQIGPTEGTQITTTTDGLQPGDEGYNPTTITDPNAPIILTQAEVDASNEKREKEEVAKLKAEEDRKAAEIKTEEDRKAAEIAEEADRLAEMTAQKEYEKEQERIRLEKIKEKEDQRQINSEGQTRVDALDDEDPEYDDEEIQADLQRITDEEGSGEEVELTQIEKERAEKKTRLPGESKHKADIRRKKEAKAAKKKAEEEANASTDVDVNAGVVDLTGQDVFTTNEEDQELDNTNPNDVIAANDELTSDEAEERYNAANPSTEVTEGEEVPGLADIHREIEVVGINGNTETITVPNEEETGTDIIERLDLEGNDNKSLKEKLKTPPTPPTAVELEADRVRHIQGDEYDRRKTLITNYESNKTNSILKILKNSNLDADFSGVTNKQEFIELANKSEDDGGLGYGVQYEDQDAEAVWNRVSEQLGVNAEVVHAGMQVEQADRVFHQVLTEGNFDKPEHVGVPSDNAEDYALFKNALLNAIPYEEFREISLFGGNVSTLKKEEYIAKANHAVLSIKLGAQNEQLKAINANGNNVDFRINGYKKKASTWMETAQATQDEINALKRIYGTHNRGTNGTLRFEQQVKMTPADQQRLIRLNKDMESLEGERLVLIKDRDEVTSLQENYNIEAGAYDEEREKLFTQYSFDEVNNIFKPVFESTKADLLYNESIRNNYGKTADVLSTLGNGLLKYQILKKVLRRAAIKPVAIATLGAVMMDITAQSWEDRVFDGYNPHDVGPDNPNGISYTGMLWDVMAGAANKNYLPVSMDKSGDILNMDVKRAEGQDWLGHLYESTMPGWAGGQGNYNVYSASKSIAHSLPYMLAIASGGGAAKLAAQSERAAIGLTAASNKLYYSGKIGQKIVNGLRKDWMTSPKMMGNLNMIRINHKLTFFENYADGRRRGMDVGTAMTYGNFLSLATGVSQTIMPDYKFFRNSKGVAKQLFKDLGVGSGVTANKALTKAVSNMATKKAFKTASIQFFKEQIEEQADVIGHDIVKSLYLVKHSPDVLKVETQAQVLVHTSMLMLPISGITAARARRNLMATTYKAIHLEGKAIIDGGRQEVAAIKKRMETLTKSDKDVELGKVLKNEMDILNTSIREAENITEAMRVAPKNVTDTQIDLLVRKKKLMEEKKELGKKDKETHVLEHESIDAKIEAINIEIQENGIGKYQSKLYKTLLDNAVAFSNSKLGKSLGLTVRHFSMDEKGFKEAVEVELQDRTKRIEERNKEIKNLRKDPKANAKRIKELQLDNKRDNKNIDYSGPGFIKWRKNKDGTLSEPEIIINEEAAKDSGNFAVVLHELLHVALMRTIEKSPKSVKAIAFLLRQEMLANPEKYGDIHGYVTREDGKGGKYDQYKFEKDINNMAFDEMFTIFIEALAQGNISVEENLITKFNDFFRRLASKFGVRFEVDGHGGMINFLRDFQEEVTNGGGSFSKGMEKSMTEGMKIKTTTAQQENADAWEKKMIKLHELDAWGFDDIMVSKSIVTRRGDIYNSKKVKEDLKLSENTIKIVEENRKIRELMMEEGLERDGKIVASEALQARLVENNLPTAISLGNFAARNPKIMGLEAGKRVTADQFISGYYLQLTELARTYDANVNEFGQYMNTILPLRYGQILESEKKGSVEGDSKGLDYIADMGDDTDMITTPDDVSTGPTIDTAERLGVKKETKSFVNEGLDQIKELRGLNAMLNESYSDEVAERVAELTAELESKGMLDLDIQNLTVKKAPNLLYKTVAKIFGIDEDKINPRSTKWLANLRKDDKKGSNEVRSAQRAVVKHINVIMASIFNEGHTMAHKSSGMPNSLLAFGYNKSSKRIGNSFPQYKKPNLSENDLLEFLGIFKVKRNGVAGYEFRIDRNTGTKLIAIAQMTDRNMSLQAINKGLEQTGDLDVKVKNSIEDGLSRSSRSITYIRSEHQQTIKRGMPEIGRRLEMLDKEWKMEDIELIFKDVFNGSGVKHKKLAREMFSATGIIMAYRTAKKGAMSVGENEFTSFEEWTVEHLEVLESEDYTNSIIKLMGITSVNGNKPTNGEFFTVDGLKDGRTHIGLFMASISEMVSDPENPMTLERALDLIWIIEQQHKTAAQAGDGSTWFVDGTNETEQALYPKDKKISKGKSKGKPHPDAGKQVVDGKHRFQHFASKEGSTVDFRKFVNSYLSSELQLPLSGTYSDHQLQTQNKHGVAKSVADKKYNEKLRKTEAELAKEAVIIQVIHFAKRLRNKNDNFNEVDFARQMLVFGSSMGTASRRAAQVIGIQDGIIIDGVYDSSVGIILEHGKPHSFLIAELIKIIKTKNESEWAKAMEVPFIDYKANIITNKFDETLTEGGRKSIMNRNPAKYVAGLIDGWTQRLFNVENLGNKHVTVIRLISDVMKGNFNGKVFGEGHGAAAGLDIKSEEQTNVDKKINEGLKRSKSINYNKSPRGITVLDFDDTLATTKSGVRANIPNTDGLPKPGRKVIFLAGGAGSGKGNVISKLGLEKQGFKVVNSDISLEWLKNNDGLPENMNDFTKEQRSTLGSLQHQARGIARRKMMKYQGEGGGVVVDGTGGSIKSMENLVNEFKAKGYDVSMVFAETSLDIALERNAARKERSLLDKIVEKNHEAVQGNKDGFKEMFGDRFMEVNTDNLSQKDAMPSELTNKMNDFVSGYENRRLDAEEFARDGASILEQGGTFDFSEFNEVVEGQTAPLFEKAMKLQGKFGNKDMFVLTARPAESADAIHAFLTANGLNIPLKNITGLGNSTANAKALWMAEKVGEGYNDFYFADDALQNVQAVDNILEQFDVKRKVQQARSKSINFNRDFNEMLDSTTGVDADKQFSAAKAKKRGEDKGRWAIFIPPSAEDFVGLLYYFIGKGKKGEEQFKWFKDNLISPLNRAYRELDSAKQAISNDYKRLSESFPDVRKKLFKKIEGSEFTYNDAIRVYLWSKFGFKIWGLSETDRKELVGIVEADENLVGFAETLGKISKSEKGYVAPTEQWMVEDIRTDLMEATNKVGRKIFFAEFLENAAIVFSEENLNKIEAIYGSDFREALEDMLYRIENGTNRSFGNNKLVNRFMNWINGSVGTTMFFNSRSAVLQSLSLVNFINWTDNNLLAAAKAFANPKQFWADFTMIFNSDMLKQRRAGRSFDINSQELASQVSNSKKPFRSALNYLLQLGFLPTQIMDSFAIASGGSAFYRNRVNTYLVDGLTLVEAEQRAFADFQEIAEATQQSARQDMVSQQQASVLGRVILAFQNTPMQYARLMKKSILDLVAGRGDAKTHVSRIIYYGAVQNIMFYTLQTALFAAMFGDDEDEEAINKKTERVISGSIDSILRGMGVGGAVVATLKNMVIKFAEEQGKPRHQKNDAAVLMEMLNISPPIGIKARQIQSAQRTLNWNQDTISEMPYYNLNNPVWESAALTTQALTNIPLARLHSKVSNLRESMNKENEGWQRIALFMGWTKWNLGMGSKKKKKSTKGFKRKEFKRDTFKRKVFTREI
jgi:hypothetical protein